MMFEGLVLVVDDQPIAVEDSIAALKHYVSEEQILYTAYASKAVQFMDTRPVSLVFLDIEMPDTSGFALAAHIEEYHKEIPYVFLTGHADFLLFETLSNVLPSLITSTGFVRKSTGWWESSGAGRTGLCACGTEGDSLHMQGKEKGLDTSEGRKGISGSFYT